MTINTSHICEPIVIRTSINTPKKNTRKIKSNEPVRTNTKDCLNIPIPLSDDNPIRKEKLRKITLGNHRKQVLA